MRLSRLRNPNQTFRDLFDYLGIDLDDGMMFVVYFLFYWKCDLFFLLCVDSSFLFFYFVEIGYSCCSGCDVDVCFEEKLIDRSVERRQTRSASSSKHVALEDSGSGEVCVLYIYVLGLGSVCCFVCILYL